MIDFIHGIHHSHNEQIQTDLFLVSLKHWALAQSAQCSPREHLLSQKAQQNVIFCASKCWFGESFCLCDARGRLKQMRAIRGRQFCLKNQRELWSSRTEGCLNRQTKKKLVSFWRSSSRSMAWWVLKGMAWWLLWPGYAIEVSTPSSLLPVPSGLLAFWGRAQILVWKKTKLPCRQRNSQPSSERQTSVQKQK